MKHISTMSRIAGKTVLPLLIGMTATVIGKRYVVPEKRIVKMVTFANETVASFSSRAKTVACLPQMAISTTRRKIKHRLLRRRVETRMASNSRLYLLDNMGAN